MPEFNKNILATALGMEPADAINYMESKGFKITWDWTETLNEANNKVFQVAKSMRMDVLQDIRSEVQKAIDKGIPFNKFRENLEPTLVKKGWWGKKTIVGPRGVQTVQLGSPHRLKTIYSTNVQSAYNAGRWKGQEANKERRPYLMLIEFLDKAARVTHKSRSGSIAPVDSRFWQGPASWYPPNGFGCRGRVRSLTEEQAKARGIGLKGFGRPDPGFGGNPGITIWKPKKADYDKDIWEKGEQLAPPAPISPETFKPAKTIKEANSRLSKVSDHVGINENLSITNEILSALEENLKPIGIKLKSLEYIRKNARQLGKAGATKLQLQKTFLKQPEQRTKKIVVEFENRKKRELINIEKGLLDDRPEPLKDILRKKKLNILNSKTPFSFATTKRKIYAVAKHESYHTIFFEKDLKDKFLNNIKGIPINKWFSVSEYAGSNLSELFAELGTQISLGNKIPNDLKTAFLKTMKGI